MMKSLVFALLLAVFACATASAQTVGHGLHHAGAVPTEVGQGAFAAIQEIVAIFEADPRTDWSRVDVDALRRHLADMNALILSAVVREKDIPGGLEVTVDGAGRAGAAARRMVPAHARELEKIEDWRATAELLPDGGVRLKVTGNDETLTARIRGLGFFGLMASGGHHQSHHLAIARGETVH